MSSRQHVARVIAFAIVAGPQNVDELTERVSRILGRRWRWIRPLATRVLNHFGSTRRPRFRVVKQFIVNDAGFQRAWAKGRIEITGDWSIRRDMFPSSGPAQAWHVPTITTPGGLSEWLGLKQNELIWLADVHGLERKSLSPSARNYRYRVLSKGSRRFRLIEAPKPRLKQVQRRILHGILAMVPLHNAAHAFRTGRSIRTFVAPHIGQRVLLKMDMQDFFPTVSISRISALFLTLGYPEEVADLLAGLCTNCVPDEIWDESAWPWNHFVNCHVRWKYERRHLPQGAPTSPAIANLCAYRLDSRLAGLARRAGCNYTRYADDMAFSGDGEFQRSIRRFRIHVAAITMDEGFAVNFRKTRVMRASARQLLAGVIINQRMNIRRANYDRLKATLFNCQRLGPKSQIRDGCDDLRARLAGKISFVESLNPHRGGRLRAIFDQIIW